MTVSNFANPYKPGAGHTPPYLAGREGEKEEFLKLLSQDTILDNMVLTGLRGVGKTVLLDTFKPLAIETGWLWVGTDLSESATLSESNMAMRLLTDIAIVTSNLVISETRSQEIGFLPNIETDKIYLNYDALTTYYDFTPGLVSDKLKSVLEFVWESLSSDRDQLRGLVFAYDEAQNLSDHASKEEYPLSILLDIFQSIQKKNIPFMLVLTGLPTLFPKLVEARTFAERMFRVVFLNRLGEKDSRDAILKPIELENSPIEFNPDSVTVIVELSGGYPYFVQFICREVYDVWLQNIDDDEPAPVPINAIMRKLDTDFFAGRWARATDRQRELLRVVAELEHCETEFTVQEIVQHSKEVLEKPFSSSHVNQMLSSLSANGLVYKNRHGKYSFAVPLLGEFIIRQTGE